MDNKKIIIFILCLIFVVGFIYFITVKNNSQDSKQTINLKSAQNETQNRKLESQTNSEGGVSIEVAPLNFESGKQIQFEIDFTTHQGDLDFDLTKQAVLYDESGSQYSPLSWSGGRGGHHLSGKLIFPLLKEKTGKIKLVFKNIYDVKERVFEWDLD